MSHLTIKQRRVVVDVCDEDHHDGGGSVDGVGVGRHSGLHAALAVIHGGHIQLVLVPVQVYWAIDQSDHTSIGFYTEQSRGGGSSNKSKGYSITVLK